MRNFLLAAPIAAILCIGLVIPASASVPLKRERRTYLKLYFAVKSEHGKRAPGRQILKHGVRTKHGVRRATAAEVATSIRALRLLHNPYIAAVVPRQPPAGVMSGAPTGLAACIVAHESGGNPMATNGQYHGIAQWSPEAWARHGGLKFASDPHGASYQQQLQVLSNGLARFGCSDWCPYDGCG